MSFSVFSSSVPGLPRVPRSSHRPVQRPCSLHPRVNKPPPLPQAASLGQRPLPRPPSPSPRSPPWLSPRARRGAGPRADRSNSLRRASRASLCGWLRLRQRSHLQPTSAPPAHPPPFLKSEAVLWAVPIAARAPHRRRGRRLQTTRPPESLSRLGRCDRHNHLCPRRCTPRFPLPLPLSCPQSLLSLASLTL